MTKSDSKWHPLNCESTTESCNKLNWINISYLQVYSGQLIGKPWGTTLLLHSINVEFTVLEQTHKHLMYIKGVGVGCVDEIAVKI